MLVWLAACAPFVDVVETGLVGPATGDHAVVATVATDYATGSLATVDLDDLRVDDDLVPVTGDPAVASDDGLVIQLDRFGYDTVRLLDPGRWSAPRWQREVGDHANPHDAAICADKLFVTLNSRPYVGVYRLSDGAEVGQVDLSAFDDGDGVGPEASTLVERDRTLIVGLQRLDQAAEWVDRGGAVVEIDCESEVVTRSWAAGANTAVAPWDDDRVLVTAGPYGDDPGGLYALTPDDGALTPLMTAAALGDAPAGAAVTDHTALVATLSADHTGYALRCVDLERGDVEVVLQTDSFVTAVERAPDGAAWVALHWGWTDPERATAGVQVVDLPSCAPRDGLIHTSLGPYDVAFVDVDDGR